MNRLQTLRECVYQSSTRTCTCFAGILDPHIMDHDATLRYVFASTPDCSVVHGTLYACLRAMFGLSVIGILVSIFSCMLVYQILSHEKKKKYLEQLDIRCRYLYRRPGLPSNYGCCGDNTGRYHNTPEMCSWQQWDALNHRLWSPGSDNFYSPTPANTTPPLGSNSGNSGGRSRTIGWSWLPWHRNSQNNAAPSTNTAIEHQNREQPEQASTENSVVMRQNRRPPPNPHWRHSHSDAIYGFRQPLGGIQQARQILSSYSFLGPYSQAGLSLSQLDNLPNLLWGPPPPYSHPPSLENINSSPQRQLSSNNPINSPEPRQPQQVPNNNLRALTDATSLGNEQTIARTTKSGILVSSPGIDGQKNIAYDNTVDSAMHIYEKAGRSGSLPSRRTKQKMCRTNVPHAKSIANLIKEVDRDLTKQKLTHKLNALNLRKNEELKAAEDLEEIKKALQSLQQNSLSVLGQVLSDMQNRQVRKQPIVSEIYFSGTESSVTSSSKTDASSLENKYETIGASLRPHKLPNCSTPSNVNAPIRKAVTGVISSPRGGSSTSQLTDLGRMSASGKRWPPVPGKTISDQNLSLSGIRDEAENSYGFSSVMSMSVGSGAGHSNLSSPSSHYSAILPLSSPGGPSSQPNSPLKSYFHPIYQPDQPSNGGNNYINTKSLPNINSNIIQAANNKFLHLQAMASAADQSRNTRSGITSPKSNVAPPKSGITSPKSGVTSPKSSIASPKHHISPIHHISPQHNMSHDKQQNSNQYRPSHHLKLSSSKNSASTEAISSCSNQQKESYHPAVTRAFNKGSSLSDINGNPSSSPADFLNKNQPKLEHSLDGLISPTRMYPMDYQPPTRPRSTQVRKPGCVFLRPEQNIPEIFSTKFKPIVPDVGEALVQQTKEANVTDQAVSRDDIVVTLRSVNV